MMRPPGIEPGLQPCYEFGPRDLLEELHSTTKL